MCSAVNETLCAPTTEEKVDINLETITEGSIYLHFSSWNFVKLPDNCEEMVSKEEKDL